MGLLANKIIKRIEETGKVELLDLEHAKQLILIVNVPPEDGGMTLEFFDEVRLVKATSACYDENTGKLVEPSFAFRYENESKLIILLLQIEQSL